MSTATCERAQAEYNEMPIRGRAFMGFLFWRKLPQVQVYLLTYECTCTYVCIRSEETNKKSAVGICVDTKMK